MANKVGRVGRIVRKMGLGIFEARLAGWRGPIRGPCEAEEQQSQTDRNRAGVLTGAVVVHGYSTFEQYSEASPREAPGTESKWGGSLPGSVGHCVDCIMEQRQTRGESSPVSIACFPTFPGVTIFSTARSQNHSRSGAGIGPLG